MELVPEEEELSSTSSDVDEYHLYDAPCHISSVEYESEIMELKEALQDSRMQVEHLKTQLSNAKSLIRQMEIELFKAQEDFCYKHIGAGSSNNSSNSSDSSVTTSSSDPSSSDEPDRRKRGFSKEVLERWEFYNKHKADPGIVGPLQAKFRSIGIDYVPWHLLKKKTDELYFKRPRS